MRALMEKIMDLASKKRLDCLLIGGNSLAFYGYPRNTLDIDFLVREDQMTEWEALFEVLQYRKFHSTAAFAQFELEGAPPVDLMIVTGSTWEKLSSSARKFRLGNVTMLLPSPEHIVALKLHSANSPYRSKPEQDWEDIRQLVRIHDLNPEEEPFQQLVLRYGGEVSLQRVREYYHGSGC